MFNNAVVLVPHAVRSAQRLFDDDPFALWCRGDDIETAAALVSAGFRRDVTTRPMGCKLADADLPVSSVPVLGDVDLVRIAELNGLPGDVLVGVPGARGFATSGFEAGVVLIEVESDVNVSFVATRHDARRRGRGDRRRAPRRSPTRLDDCQSPGHVDGRRPVRQIGVHASGADPGVVTHGRSGGSSS